MAKSITAEQWAGLQMPPDADTFPKLMKRNYLKWGDKRVAYRHKDYGYWLEFTWKDYYERVKWLCGGFISMGFKPGDRVSIVGENAPEWFWGQLAAQSAGGASVGLYTDSTPSELQFVIDHSDSVIVMADDQEQVDKILSIREQLPKVKKVVFWDARGMWDYDDEWLQAFDDVMEMGQQYEKEHPGFFEELIDKTRGDDVGVVLYTSGTTGLPKGPLVSYDNLLSLYNGWDATLPWYGTDENLSFLPPAWIGEQIFTVAPNLAKGVVVNFIEEPETVREDIREVAPRVMLFGARNWEMYCSLVMAKMIDSSAMKKLIYNMFLPVGYRVSDFEQERKKVGWLWRLLYKIGYHAVFRALVDKVGFSKTRVPITAGAALAPDNFAFLRAIGIPVAQGYGATEVSGLDVVQLHPEYFRYEGSGQPFAGVEVRINEEGEILLGGVGVVHGYYKRPDKTAEAFKDGYFYTGDGGSMDDEGELYIIDRVKDMMTLRSGEKFSPTYIEGKLKFSPYIKDAWAIGGGDKDYVTAVLNMDFENTGRWAEMNHLVYTSHPDLSQKERVAELMAKEVERVNRTLPEKVRVKRFLVLHKDFDPDESELTRTRKLRRSFLEKRYDYLVNGLYSEEDTVNVESTITYRDGHSSVMRVPVRVNTMW